MKEPNAWSSETFCNQYVEEIWWHLNKEFKKTKSESKQALHCTIYMTKNVLSTNVQDKGYSKKNVQGIKILDKHPKIFEENSREVSGIIISNL